ncbi:prepilin-type N-terminal cleavage/methylation domain-containing protein [Oxalobacteraceae bacterium A2-2]
MSVQIRFQRALRQRAFTLVEVAIVLVVVGLLIGGLLTPLQTQFEQRRASDTQRGLEEAREALFGFALRNGYLPCPAISASDGQEDRTGPGCTEGRRAGYLPWATLGVTRLDGWNRLYYYSVTPAFSNSAYLFTLRTPRDISIATRDAGGQLVAAAGVADTVAVVMSVGKNGYGGTSSQGLRLADAGSGNTDEKLNLASGGTAFITRDPSDNPAAPGGPFDDMLVWISPNVLYNRMVAAQRLP